MEIIYHHFFVFEVKGGHLEFFLWGHLESHFLHFWGRDLLSLYFLSKNKFPFFSPELTKPCHAPEHVKQGSDSTPKRM